MKEKIKDTLKKFNKNKSDEINATLINLKSNSIKIKFSGKISCKKCCLNDYFEEITKDLNEKGIKNELKWINMDENYKNYLVEYEIL
jgi:hypothetical protein